MTDISRTVSTALQSLRMRETTTRLAGQIADAAQEVTTGLKAQPLDALGPKAADAIALRMQIVRNDGFLANNALLDQRFAAVENALGAMRTAGQTVLDQSFLAQPSSGTSSGFLSQAARSAIDTVIERSSVSGNGGFLMGGTRTDTNPLQGWTTPHPDTGLSPAGIVADIVGGGVTSLADANDRITALKAAFSDADTARPDRNFEASFYNGAPSGQADSALTSRISTTETIEQPAQANAPAMRDLLRGLAMLDAVDVNQITDPDAREAWLTEARNAIASGLSGLNDLETAAGLSRNRIADTRAAQESLAGFLDSESLLLEGADQYDAATRLTQLQTQLESSYAVTARLSRMSFLNYL